MTSIFILRPVMTTLVMAALCLFGALAYTKLPVSDLPSVDFPTIQVTANMSGASPETMASSIALPLEKQFSTISGLDSMSSQSALGVTRVTLQFNLDRNIDAASLDVQTAIAASQKNLPTDITVPPTARKVNPADQPVLYLAISSTAMRLSDVNEFAENQISPSISMVPGVAQVLIYGQAKYAVRIQIDPDALASRDIGMDELVAALKSGNVNLPTGSVQAERREYTVTATGQLFSAEEFKPLIIAYRSGAPVRLRDVAKVIDSVEESKRLAKFDGEPSLILAIQRQPGANTVEVVDAIKALLPQFRASLPAAINLEVMYDRSQGIRESVADVKFTMYLTIALVIAVIFLFLRNMRATLIPSLALPTSIIGTFAAMKMLGFSLDNISLMALTLSVGFVVDDAIVMLENIVRHLEMGKTPMQASLDGAGEIGFTIVSMTISLAAVFLPVLFMGGIVGRLFYEFAVTIGVAVLLSGFVSLTLTPMLCSRMLRAADAHAQGEHAGDVGGLRGKFYGLLESGFMAMQRFYEVTLAATMRYKLACLIGSLSLLFVTGYLFSIIPKGFLPSEDIGQVVVITEAEQGISFQSMVVKQGLVADICAAEPGVQSVLSVVGGGGPNAAGNAGRLMLKLKPHHEREGISAEMIVNRLRPKLAQVPGLASFPQNPPAIRIGGQSTKALYQFILQSPNTADLYDRAEDFTRKVRSLPGFTDVNSDMQLKNPQLAVSIDRDKASALGVAAYQIEDALSSAFSTRQVSTIYAANSSYMVITELMPKEQRDPQALDAIYVRAKSGKLVPLSTLLKSTLGAGPLLVNHSGQMPSVTVSFNLQPGTSIGDAVASLEELAVKELPASVSTAFAGTAQAFQASFKGLGLLVLMAIVVIYIVLGILYESFIHPLTILSGLPSAGVGALLTLLVFNRPLDIYGFVGIIMLIGIVKKNAIMMIDFAMDATRNKGMKPEDAILEGCRTRFRPIMMTTMAALMGTLPIAVGLGAGGDARAPLGLTVVGGLCVSQVLTLYFTPVYYVYLDRLAVWMSAGKTKKAPKEPAPQPS